jgi:hypothetical protein
MKEFSKPERRHDRDLVPVGAPRRAPRTATDAVQPLLDGVHHLGDTIDALADKVRDQKHPVEDERAREDHVRELRALEEHLRRPTKAGMLDTPRTRITMSQRLDALRKYQESK